MSAHVAVIGAGNWGTALANLLANKGCVVTVWSYEPDVAEAINAQHQNPKYLRGIELGLQELAVQCYAYTTLHIHTTPTRLISRLEETEEVLRFKDGPQRAEADAALVGAHCCIAHVLESQNQVFNLGIAGLETELAAGIEQAWGPDPGWRVP